MFDEYYGVERFQNCWCRNESKFLRTLGKFPLRMGSRTYIYQCQTEPFGCHKKSPMFICFTRLARSTTESSGFKTVVGSTNRCCCEPWVKPHSEWATKPILSYLRPGYCDVTRNEWTSFALQDSPGVLPGRAASKLLLAQRIEIVAYSW